MSRLIPSRDSLPLALSETKAKSHPSPTFEVSHVDCKKIVSPNQIASFSLTFNTNRTALPQLRIPRVRTATGNLHESVLGACTRLANFELLTCSQSQRCLRTRTLVIGQSFPTPNTQPSKHRSSRLFNPGTQTRTQRNQKRGRIYNAKQGTTK